MRAVDRVDVPADGRVASLRAVFLADEPVVREGVEQALTDHPLDGLVGLGDECSVGLGFDLEITTEVLAGDDIGRVTGRDGDGQPGA